MQQVKLNLLHPISTSSGSIASVFTIDGVMYEGPEEVVSWRRLTSVIYFSIGRGSYLSGRDPVMETSSGRKLFVSASSSGIFCAVPRRI